MRGEIPFLSIFRSEFESDTQLLNARLRPEPLTPQLTNFSEVGVEVSILTAFSTAVSPILLFPMTFHVFFAIANIYATIAKFVGVIGYCPRPNSRYSVMVCTRLGRAPHSPRYVQTSTQHSPNSLALLVLSTAKFTLFSHGLHTFGKSPTFPKIRANIDATIAEFVGVVGFVHGQIHAIWSVLSSRHLRPIPHKSFTLTK